VSLGLQRINVGHLRAASLRSVPCPEQDKPIGVESLRMNASCRQNSPLDRIVSQPVEAFGVTAAATGWLQLGGEV